MSLAYLLLRFFTCLDFLPASSTRVLSLELSDNHCITACKRSLCRLCFHRCLSTQGGGCLPLVPGGHTPLGRQTPGQTHPLSCACWDTPSRYGQQADGTHPTGMYSCLTIQYLRHLFGQHIGKDVNRICFGFGSGCSRKQYF